MTTKQDTVTLEHNVPIPEHYRYGGAKELAESMKPGSSYLLPTRSRAVSIANALRNLGHTAVVRMQKDKKSGKTQGHRVWRSS
jgi:hypothetical protein